MARTSISSTSTDAPAFYHWAGKLAQHDAPARRPYKTYRELWTAIGELARLHDRVRIHGIGRSGGGEPMWAVTAGDHGPAVFVLAGLHAMEHVGPASALALIERAARGAARWSGRRLVVVPLANPDGYLACEAMLARGRRGFVRRNRRGVDLNRNFAVGWDDSYYLNRVLRPLFAPGDAPLSEPETQAIDRVVATERPRVAVSLHAFGEVIYYPYAGTDEAPPDLARLDSAARAMAARMPGGGYRAMQLGKRSHYFKACGSEIDHFYGRYGALSFLIEIGAGPRLTAPSTWLTPYRWYTPPDRLLERDIAKILPALDYLAELE